MQYEWNARTQVTMWYDNTKTNQSKLHDYGRLSRHLQFNQIHAEDCSTHCPGTCPYKDLLEGVVPLTSQLDLYLPSWQLIMSTYCFSGSIEDLIYIYIFFYYNFILVWFCTSKTTTLYYQLFLQMVSKSANNLIDLSFSPPANKFWSGLLKDYYLPRASMYFNYLSQSLTQNKSFKLEEWRRGWISYSNTWQSSSKKYPTEATGDAYAISKSLFKKYLSWLNGKFPNLNPEFYYLRWRGML